jgi:hypothetical protein
VDFVGRPWGGFAARQFQRQFRIQTVKLEVSATVSCRKCHHVPVWRQFRGETVTGVRRQFRGESVTGWRPDDSFGPKLSTTRRRLTGSLRLFAFGRDLPVCRRSIPFRRQFRGESVTGVRRQFRGETVTGVRRQFRAETVTGVRRQFRAETVTDPPERPRRSRPPPKPQGARGKRCLGLAACACAHAYSNYISMRAFTTGFLTNRHRLHTSAPRWTQRILCGAVLASAIRLAIAIRGLAGARASRVSLGS